MLAGIYTILPLQSPLNILSTTLYPSSVPIPVFGPSSHPTPVITPSGSKLSARTSEYLSRLSLGPTFQRGDNRTIFLIREYECGFQGLRNGVVPGFSNIWGEDRGLWGLKSIHPVRLASLVQVQADFVRYSATIPRYIILTSNPNHGPNLSNRSYQTKQRQKTVMTKKSLPQSH